MARLPDGSWLVAFERHHRLWRYPTLASKPTPVDGPADIGRQPANGGIEALTALADGRIIAHQRGIQPAAGHGGGLDRPAGQATAATNGARSVRQDPRLQSDGDRAGCPTASFALLERAFDMVRGVRCRVMRFEAAQLKPGGIVQRRGAGAARLALCGRQSGRASAATRGPRGETLLWLISDDNFNPLQRNILLLFELAK